MSEVEAEEKAAYEAEVKEIKSLRQGLDVQLQALKKMTFSPERSTSIQKIQEGIMWLGMDLKRMGEQNPYPNSYNAENAVIEPTADKLKL